jgi:hypothetical protein
MVFREVAHILACSCAAEMGVRVLDLLSPRLTSGRRLHTFWLLALTCGVFYSTYRWEDGGNFSRQSVGLVVATALIPVWVGLYGKALFDEQFLGVYDRCDHNLGVISSVNVYDMTGALKADLSGSQPSKQRASALLALTLVIRFVLTMLSHLGLGDEDMDYLGDAHASFVLSIAAARDNEARRRHRQIQMQVHVTASASPASMRRPSMIIDSPTTMAVANSAVATRDYINSEGNGSGTATDADAEIDADAHVSEMAEACVKFLAQIMSIFVTKLRSHSNVKNVELVSRGDMVSVMSAMNVRASGGGSSGGSGRVGSGGGGGGRPSSIYDHGGKNRYKKIVQWRQSFAAAWNDIMSNSFIDSIERILVPLPSPLEPSSGVLHFCMSSVLVMYGVRYFVTPFSISILGRRGSIVSKWARSTLLMYMMARLMLNKTKAILWLENQRGRRTPRSGSSRLNY